MAIKTIFTIDDDFCRKVNVCELLVEETPKLFRLVDRNGSYRALGYRSQIDKGSKHISFSREEALRKYIEAKESELEYLRQEIESKTRMIEQARALSADIAEGK